jgi:hypothetical protein
VAPLFFGIGSGIDMTRFQKDRMAVLPATKSVPKLLDLEKHFIEFWTKMRRNLHDSGRNSQLTYSETRKAKNLADDAHKRRLRESGLSLLKAEDRSLITALAQEGGKLGGPGTEDDVYQLVATLHAESPWMRDVSAWAMRHMLRHLGSGGYGFALPPVILAGPPGIGKSHYARTLAKLAEVPVRMIDVGGGSAGFRIAGTEKGWGTAQAGIPVETLLSSKVANPILVVDEIDKAGTTFSTKGTSSSLTTSMLQMLEPTSARHFECPYFRVPFDMSRVVWIMTANEVERIPAPLRDRTRLFVLPPLSAHDAVAHFDRLTSGCESDDHVRQCRDFITEMCGRPAGISLRQIQQLADAANSPLPVLLH